MCAQSKKQEDLRQAKESMNVVWLRFYRASLGPQALMQVAQNNLQEWVEELPKRIQKKQFLDEIRNLRKLTGSQLANYIALLELYEYKPDWYDNAALIATRNKKASYRSTISKNFSRNIDNKNIRGNKAFGRLIQKSYHYIKKQRRSTDNSVYFTRKCAVYRPKGFFRNYGELYSEWRFAIECMKFHYKLVFDKLKYEETDLQIDELINTSADSATNQINRLVKREIESRRKMFEEGVPELEKKFKLILGRTASKLAKELYEANDLLYDDFIRGAKLACNFLLKWLTIDSDYSRKMTEGIKKKLGEKVERMLLNPAELDEFNKRLQTPPLDASKI